MHIHYIYIYIYEKVERVIKRTKVVEALLRRGKSVPVWDRLQVDAKQWKFVDCANPRGERVPDLAYGLERIVGLDGKVVPLAAMPPGPRRDLREVQRPQLIYNPIFRHIHGTHLY